LCDKNDEGLKKTAARCEEKGLDKSKIYTVVCDLTKEGDIQNLVTSITDHYQQVDVLINNAGYIIPGGIEKTTLEDFDSLYILQIRAVVSLTQKLLPYLKKSRGSVVSVSSMSSMRPAIHSLSYGVMKAALDYLSRCLALELGPAGVRVNTINPGYTKTNIYEASGIAKNKDEVNEIAEKRANAFPLKRVAEPEEMADAMMYLASSKASFVTGCNFVIDGGYTQTVGPL